MGPPGGRGQGGSPTGSKGSKGSGGWTEATRERLAARSSGEEARRDSLRTSEQVTRRALDIEEARQSASGVWRTEEAASSSSVSMAAVYQAAIEGHRFDSGVRASGFEPQRHALYVLGRPVQVSSGPEIKKALYPESNQKSKSGEETQRCNNEILRNVLGHARGAFSVSPSVRVCSVRRYFACPAGTDLVPRIAFFNLPLRKVFLVSYSSG